ASVALDERSHLGTHAQLEVRRALSFLGEKGKEVPLRHHRDEATTSRQMAQIGHRDLALAELRRKSRDLLVRQPQQALEQPELVHHLQRRGVNRVAAEVTQKIGVLLQHERAHAGAGEQQPEHHARRAAAGNADLAGQARDSAAFTLSALSGALRRRTPVASKTAFATAAGTTRIVGSPAPDGATSGRLISTTSIAAGASCISRIG